MMLHLLQSGSGDDLVLVKQKHTAPFPLDPSTLFSITGSHLPRNHSVSNPKNTSVLANFVFSSHLIQDAKKKSQVVFSLFPSQK
jgi:hypothetical protein